MSITKELLQEQFNRLHLKDRKFTRRIIARQLSRTDKIIYAEYISDLFNYGEKLESLGAEVKRFMDEKEKELRGKK